MIQSLPKPSTERSTPYMRWIKTLPCLLDSRIDFGFSPSEFGPCVDEMDPHHVVPKGGAKTGKKTDDTRTVPLCRRHHELAQSKPDYFRDWFEAKITSLKLKWDFMTRPTPKPRKRAFKADVRVRNCVLCGQTHLISLAKVTIGQREVRYWCANRSQNAVGERKVKRCADVEPSRRIGER